MKIRPYLLIILLNFASYVFAQETIVGDAYDLETETHSWAVISVNITDSHIIVKKVVTPKISPTWICNSKSEFIEDAETHERFYITNSDIGFLPKEYILWNTNPVVYEEQYPKITEKTKSIHIFSGNEYLAKDVELDWEGYNESLYRKSYVDPTIRAMKNEDYIMALKLSIIQLNVAKKKFGSKDANTAAAYGIVGMCYANNGEYQKAIEYARKSLAIYQTNYKNVLGFEHHPDEMAILNNLGQYHALLGNYLLALEHAQKVANIAKEAYGSQSLQYMNSLINLAMYNIQIGNLNEGLSLLTSGEQICNVLLNGPNKQTELLETLINNFEETGDTTNYLKAKQKLESYQVSLKIIYSSILNNLGICLWKSNRLTEAVDAMRRCTDLRKSTLGDHHSSYAEALMNQALYEGSVYHKDISKELDQVHQIFLNTFGENHPTVALILNNLSICQLNLGNQTKAINYAKEALRIRKRTYGESHIEYIRSLLTLSIALLNSDRQTELEEVVKEEIKLSANHSLANLRLMTSSQRERFWNSIKLYGDIPLLLMSNKLPPSKDLLRENYNALLQSKGLLLTSTIEFEKTMRDTKNTQILSKFEKIKTLQRKYDFYANRPIANRPLEEMELWKSEITTLEQQLINESKSFSDITRKLKTTWKDVKRSLKDNEIAVEFIHSNFNISGIIEPYYAALLLKNDWDAPKKIEICSGKFMQQIEKRGPALYSSPEGNKLYSAILEQIEPYIHEGDCIYFSPAGALHKINLGALTDKSGKLACEKYQFRRLTSTREICYKESEGNITTAVLYGGLNYNMDLEDLQNQNNSHHNRSKLIPLPGTYVEIKQIEKFLEEAKIKVKTYSGKMGIEPSFKALSGNSPSILHIATHGFFFDNNDTESLVFYELLGNEDQKAKNPLQRTGLFLAGATKAWNGENLPNNVDDGILLANEISSIDLSNTELAVLSACQSGVGEISSEGVYGLQRGFKLAGVKSIMMSLWKIDDNATSILMSAFYKALLLKKSKHDALIEAQRTLRSYKRYNNPYYWASFIILD